MWVRRWAFVTVLTVVAAACAPAGVEPATDRSPSTIQSAASPPGSDRTFGELFAERLPAILATTSEFQKALLEDGVVTAAEHERAQLAFIACIEEAGVRIVQLERTATGLISLLSVGGTPTAEAQGEVEDVVAVCDETFYSDIDDAYRVALHPDDTEATQLQRTVECANARGVAVGFDFADFSALLDAAKAIGDEARDVVIACLSEAQN
jgi:hypothetical protein